MFRSKRSMQGAACKFDRSSVATGCHKSGSLPELIFVRPPVQCGLVSNFGMSRFNFTHKS